MPRIARTIVVVSLFIVCSAALEAAGAEPVDLVAVGGVVLTVDDAAPVAEAFAVSDGRFVAVGTDEEIRAMATAGTEVLELRGRTVVPGFNDAHIHPSPKFDELSPHGETPCGPDDTPDLESMLARLRRKAGLTPVGQWVRGDRYQDTKLGRHPTRQDLDRVSMTHPVWVTHSSGHVAAVNSYALTMARIDSTTPDPPGGAFDRDAAREPTGVLRESAKGIVQAAGPESPEPTRREWVEGMRARFADFLAQGITSVQHAGTSPETVDKYLATMAEGPRVRVYAMLRHEDLKELSSRVQGGGSGSEWVRLGAVKMFHGNSLSGQTCWLYEPHADRPGYHGIPPAASQETLNRRVADVHNAGMQACVHSNGDREIDMVLDAYEAALKASPRADHRHRIEHASVVNEKILARVQELGAVLAPHSYIWEHGDKMEAYGEKRWDWMHPNGAAIRAGVPVAGNSDWPVSAAKPMLRLQSMVTRKSAEGKVYGASQRVTFEQALRAWTLGSAYAEFQEREKGSIEAGKLADFVVLGSDPRTIAPERIKDVAVEATYVGGTLAYQAP